MQTLELLAPAKNLVCGKAAIDHGADAVYIGPPLFGARVAAGNSIDDIAELCRYAQPFGVKVYATVNTLLHDDELPQAVQLIHQLADAGVDAVLIQDMRLLDTVQCSVDNVEFATALSSAEGMAVANSALYTLHSKLKFHASTQADNRTAEKVAWLWQQGFRRAVLARELSVDEVRAIHQAVPQMELEVFVHGALCVSYSGLCYASEYCFGRSANRGECAQFCRMPFDLLDADEQVLEQQRHLLSLKDLNLSVHLAELIEAGAMSFKIEGRLKDVSYVKNVTAAYSQLLNQFISDHPGRYCRASRGTCRYTFQPDLDRTFNRGYTTYFVHGRQPRQASFDTPKAIGQFVGTVKSVSTDGRRPSIVVAGTAAFVNGDGLCFFAPNRQLVGFRVNRAEGNRLYPHAMPDGLRPGVRLYRSNDQAMDAILAKPTAERKIAVTMALTPVNDADGEGFQLTMDDGAMSRSVRMAVTHQLARSPQREQIARELSKLGGTPYECTSVILPDDFPYFIPASLLAEGRRKVSSQNSPSSPNSPTPGPSRGGEGSIYTQPEYSVTEQHTPNSHGEDSAAELHTSIFHGENSAAELHNPISHVENSAAELHNPISHVEDSAAELHTSIFHGENSATELHTPNSHGENPVEELHTSIFHGENSAAELYTPLPPAGGVGGGAVGAVGSSPLMRCRYCLRHELGFCVKRGGRKPTWREPLTLRLADGRRFPLHFDCKNCQMLVLSEERRS